MRYVVKEYDVRYGPCRAFFCWARATMVLLYGAVLRYFSTIVAGYGSYDHLITSTEFRQICRFCPSTVSQILSSKTEMR